MESVVNDEVSVKDLQQKSNAVLDDFEQQKEQDFINLLVKMVISITFNGYEKSDQVSTF